MRLPSNIGETTRTPFSGISGWTHGRFSVGSYSGGYERSEERLAFFDTFVRKSGYSEFTIAGPEISSTIEARCRMRERALDLGDGVSVTTRPMAYRCDFTADGRAIPARFELQEVTGGGTAAYRYERHGEIALGGEIVRIRSVHKLEGTALGTLTPIGYVFEQRGRPVGAVELNGKPALILPAGTEPDLARTLTIAATALAVFWDPANSQLDD